MWLRKKEILGQRPQDLDRCPRAKRQPAGPHPVNNPQKEEVVTISKQEPRHTDTASVIASYAALLAMGPGPHEHQKQLIDEIVRDCPWAVRLGSISQ